LFDLDYARRNTILNINEIVQCFQTYIELATQKKAPSPKEFLLNMEKKETDPNFAGDMEALLRPEIVYNQQKAFEWIKTTIIPIL
jgi:GTP-dependent phosphoenolpyruvate carboxykinase